MAELDFLVCEKMTDVQLTLRNAQDDLEKILEATKELGEIKNLISAFVESKLAEFNKSEDEKLIKDKIFECNLLIKNLADYQRAIENVETQIKDLGNLAGKQKPQSKPAPSAQSSKSIVSSKSSSISIRDVIISGLSQHPHKETKLKSHIKHGNQKEKKYEKDFYLACVTTQLETDIEIMKKALPDFPNNLTQNDVDLVAKVLSEMVSFKIVKAKGSSHCLECNVPKVFLSKGKGVSSLEEQKKYLGFWQELSKNLPQINHIEQLR